MYMRRNVFLMCETLTNASSERLSGESVPTRTDVSAVSGVLADGVLTARVGSACLWTCETIMVFLKVLKTKELT